MERSGLHRDERLAEGHIEVNTVWTAAPSGAFEVLLSFFFL